LSVGMYPLLMRPLGALIFLFFVEWSRDPRDLHSFPTRRSSDLDARGDGVGRDCGGVRDRAAPERLAAAAHSDVGSRWSPRGAAGDRKSTRLNSSHVKISYAVFCLKKKKRRKWEPPRPLSTETCC